MATGSTAVEPDPVGNRPRGSATRGRPGAAPLSGSPLTATVAGIVSLQKLVGNAAVVRLMSGHSQAPRRAGGLAVQRIDTCNDVQTDDPYRACYKGPRTGGRWMTTPWGSGWFGAGCPTTPSPNGWGADPKPPPYCGTKSLGPSHPVSKCPATIWSPDNSSLVAGLSVSGATVKRPRRKGTSTYPNPSRYVTGEPACTPGPVPFRTNRNGGGHPSRPAVASRL